VQNSYVFDAWGTARASSATLTNSFGYTAREFGEAGLLGYRARYLQPGVGRFTQEDPIRLMIGQPHLYAYVGSHPVIRTDPSGKRVKNNTPYTIFVKDEFTDKVTMIAPGGVWPYRQDGFSAPAIRKCQVYKTGDDINVTVNSDGSVTKEGGSRFEQAYDFLMGGWEDGSWLDGLIANGDTGWRFLFETAGYHDKKCGCPPETRPRSLPVVE
jgi:RHS repeat-associated protein